MKENLVHISPNDKRIMFSWDAVANLLTQVIGSSVSISEAKEIIQKYKESSGAHG